MCEGKAIIERVYWHCLCEFLPLAKWWPPADRKILRFPHISRWWKCFVNHWQSPVRSEGAVSSSLSGEPGHFYCASYKISSQIRESPWLCSEEQWGARYHLVNLRLFPDLELVLSLWFSSAQPFLLGWGNIQRCVFRHSALVDWMPFNSVS